MRTKLVLLVVAVAALTGASGAGAATLQISITAAGYVPTGGSIKVGDTVTWANADTAVHKVRFVRYPACSLDIAPGQSASCTFTSVGSFVYTDPTLSETPRGSIDVTENPLATTLQASRKTLVYGESVKLAGHLGSGKGGQKVTLQARGFDATTYSDVATTTTNAGGNFSFTHRPERQTLYRVRVGSTDSGGVRVAVRPRVTLAYGASTRLFTVRVVAKGSFAGKVVSFQRRVGSGWKTLRTATLGGGSAASVRVSLPAGRSTVRVLLPAAQSLSGYVAGVSASRVVAR